MRIVSYNILDGGEGRADPLAEVIEAQRADVVALVEADDLAVLERMANRFKMELLHAPGQHHASAILSRWPIEESINHGALNQGIHNSFLEATLSLPNAKPLSIGVVHLCPHGTEADETKREQELAIVLGAFASHREANRPHVLAGDFNANSPVQKIDPQRCKPRTKKEWDENGGQLPRRVVSKILDAGYTDSLHAVNAIAGETMGTFSTQFPEQRVDYLFSCGIDPAKLTRAWIEQDRLAKYASDHFPIGLELRL